MATMSFVLFENYNGFEKVKEYVTFAPSMIVRLSIVVLLRVEFPATVSSAIIFRCFDAKFTALVRTLLHWWELATCLASGIVVNNLSHQNLCRLDEEQLAVFHKRQQAILDECTCSNTTFSLRVITWRLTEKRILKLSAKRWVGPIYCCVVILWYIGVHKPKSGIHHENTYIYIIRQIKFESSVI